MIVCLCEGITDRQIRAACRDGAANLNAIKKACGAGAECGSCQAQIEGIVQSTRNDTSRSSLLRASRSLVVLSG